MVVGRGVVGVGGVADTVGMVQVRGLLLSLSRGFGVHRDRLSGPAMNYPGPLLTRPWRMDEIGH